ncbi:MAG: hypothetical protein MUF54_00660 [Polyangiaceae bacterium]|nr:hypothetical protein [Polyangiaceae bacterium]
MSDPNKKSPRTFQCRDVLWETFEQMARELECSIDYLINEAMKQYARQRSYGSRTPFPGRVESPAAAGAMSAQGRPYRARRHPPPRCRPPQAQPDGSRRRPHPSAASHPRIPPAAPRRPS